MKFKGKLFEYQEKAVNFCKDAKYLILGLEMGLGKSVISLKVALDNNKSTLVICPAFLKSNWESEVAKFVIDPDVDIISYSQLKKFLSKVDKSYKTIIFDEAHYVKNPTSQRSKLAHELVESINPDYMMLLTGTPLKNRIHDIWHLLKLCSLGKKYSLEQYKSHNRFCHTFCYETPFFANGYTFRRFEGLKPERLMELKTLIAPIYYRKKLCDVEIDLPEQTYKFIQTKDKNEYDRSLINAFEAFNTNRDDAAFATVKSANALAKTKYTIELAEELIAEEKSPVIFTHHRASCEAIAKHFKVPHIHGSVSPEKRSDIIDEFKAGKHCALVASIGALSVGVNLTNTNYMIFNDIPWVPSDIEQAEKRIHRVGQKSTCFYYYIFSSKIDHMIYSKIKDKKKVISNVEDAKTN